MANTKKKAPSDAEIARKVVLKERTLSANFNAQGISENKAFLEKSLRALEDMPAGSEEWCFSFLATISLLTGRSLEPLIEIGFEENAEVNEWWLIQDDEAWLCYRPDIIRDNMENTLGAAPLSVLVNVTKTTYFSQPIPRPLTRHLLVWRDVSRAMIDGKRLKKPKLPKALQEYDLRPYSFGRIASALTYYLATKRTGVAETAYLTGLSSRRCVALHYAQLASEDIVPPYIEYFLELGFKAKDIPKTPAVIVGSALTVNERSLSKIYSDLVKPLQGVLSKSVDDYICAHNEIAYLVWVYIQLSTAHRHNVTALKTLLHFDVKAGVLFVEDKTSRPLVLSKSMCDQLKYYLNYLQNFLLAAEVPYPGLASMIRGSLSGTAPLFFLISKDGKREPFSTRNLKNLTSSFWTIPANWARHFTLTKLACLLPADQFPGFAGHLEGDKEVDDEFSGLSPALQKQASEVMEKVLEELGIKPINPCLANQPSLSDMSLRTSRSSVAKGKGEDNSRTYWSLEMLQQCSSLWKWEKKFEMYLGQLGGVSSQKDWVAMILYSAMTRGGLTKPRMVFDLYKQLWSGSIRWWTVADRCFLDLRHQVKSGAYNLRLGHGKQERSYRQMHWPIDVQTLCLLLSWPRQQYLKRDHNLLAEDELAEWLSGWFTDSEQGDFKSLGELCCSIPFIQWFALKANVSYAETHITGPSQPNFAPNKASLMSLELAPKPIDWKKIQEKPLEAKDDLDTRRRKRPKNEFSQFASDLIQSTLSPANMNQREAKDKLSILMQQTEGKWSFECRVFLEWLQFKLDTIKVSSAKSYVSDIAKEWFSAVQGRSFEGLDANAILGIYKGVVHGTENTRRQQTYIARLRWLHQFGVENYGWDINNELTQFLQVSKSLTFVRTSILDYRHVYNVLEAIETLEEPEIYQTQLKLILIFGFRCGLRIGEILKLRFRDIDPKSGWAVYVRGSRHGSNKSDNALRRLELSELFTADELGLLKHYYHKLSLDSGRGDLLFGLDGENIPLDQIVVSQKLGGALRQSSGNEEVVFHSLRHSCATYTWTLLSKEYELAEKLTGFDKEKLEAVRRYWMLGDDLVRDAFWQMTRGLGHAGPATSAQTYLHLVMETVHRKLARAIWQTDSLRLSLKRLGNLRNRKLGEGYQATMCTLAKRVHERVRFSREEKRILGTEGRNYTPNLTFELPETYLVLANALQKLEARQTITDVALQYPTTEQDLESIVCRCRRLAAVKTEKGGSKFIGDKMLHLNEPGNTLREVLIPDLHNSPDVLRLVVKVSNILRKKCKKKRPRKAIVKRAMIVLKTFTASKHYLRITDRDDLTAILDFDQGAILPVFWSMKGKPLAKRGEDSTESLEQEAFNYWMLGLRQEFLNIRLEAKETSKRPNYRYGVLRARLAHSTEALKSGNDKRFLGVKMLGWLAYMTVALYGTNEEVDAFSKTVC